VPKISVDTASVWFIGFSV